jgi:hypothetical protein
MLPHQNTQAAAQTKLEVDLSDAPGFGQAGRLGLSGRLHSPLRQNAGGPYYFDLLEIKFMCEDCYIKAEPKNQDIFY